MITVNYLNKWTALFCSQCGDKQPLHDMDKPFPSEGYFCESCIDELFDESETVE